MLAACQPCQAGVEILPSTVVGSQDDVVVGRFRGKGANPQPASLEREAVAPATEGGGTGNVRDVRRASRLRLHVLHMQGRMPDVWEIFPPTVVGATVVGLHGIGYRRCSAQDDVEGGRSPVARGWLRPVPTRGTAKGAALYVFMLHVQFNETATHPSDIRRGMCYAVRLTAHNHLY